MRTALVSEADVVQEFSQRRHDVPEYSPRQLAVLANEAERAGLIDKPTGATFLIDRRGNVAVENLEYATPEDLERLRELEEEVVEFNDRQAVSADDLRFLTEQANVAADAMVAYRRASDAAKSGDNIDYKISNAAHDAMLHAYRVLAGLTIVRLTGRDPYNEPAASEPQQGAA